MGYNEVKIHGYYYFKGIKLCDDDDDDDTDDDEAYEFGVDKVPKAIVEPEPIETKYEIDDELLQCIKKCKSSYNRFYKNYVDVYEHFNYKSKPRSLVNELLLDFREMR
jgi:hypothetical protein